MLGRGLAVTLVAPGCVTATSQSHASDPTDAPRPSDARPNIVLILTEDMRWDDLGYMPHTRSSLGQFRQTQFMDNHPLCCSARTAIMTGQFAQNHGVFHNSGPYGDYSKLRDPQNVLPSWLHDAGYRTGYVGKWANGWDPSMPEPGTWDHFNPWLRNPPSSTPTSLCWGSNPVSATPASTPTTQSPTS